MMGFIGRKGAVLLSITGVLLLLFGFNGPGLSLMYLAVGLVVATNWWPSEDFEKLALLYQSLRLAMMKLWHGGMMVKLWSVAPYLMPIAVVALYFLLMKVLDLWFGPRFT